MSRVLKAVLAGSVFLIAGLISAWPTPVFAQSQAANATVEGTVSDAQEGRLPGVTVTITNIDTGAERSVISSSEGYYRALLLPLGRYRIVAELPGFKRFERTGITLEAGEVGVVNVTLQVGPVAETLTVTSETPVAQPGKIDLDGHWSDTEIHNLRCRPATLQLRVPPGQRDGYENTEFGVPRINANGSQMHTNYQLDGNTNTEKDRAGLRLLPISEVLVREVKLVTNGLP